MSCEKEKGADEVPFQGIGINELEKRWTRIRKKGKDGGDLVLASSQENSYHLTASYHHAIKTISGRLTIVGMDTEENIFALLCNLEFPPHTHERASERLSRPLIPIILTTLADGQMLPGPCRSWIF